MDLGPGDEVLTTDEEHPGILAPLAGLRDRRGVSVRVVPFDSVAAEVRPETKLVAVSHVSWITGQVVDTAALAASNAPVLLDGAQSIGAIPVDVRQLGCDFYAASGQKWLCGPNGLGYLYLRRELPAPWLSYSSVADPAHPLESELAPGAKRFDMGLVAPHHSAWALTALDVLEEPGLEVAQRRAQEMAAGLAERLAERGAVVAPRGDSTLVSWETGDPPSLTEHLLAEGIVVRHLPGTPYVRASVGGWTSEEELERLVTCAS
jgi:L-cysteine/cystine lyase